MTLTIIFEIINEEGCDEEYTIPAKYMVCPNCKGTGRQTNPAIDGHGISGEEWSGPDWSDEDKQSYLNGEYDINCTKCNGKNVILEADEEACPLPIWLKYQTYLRDKEDDRIEQMNEREMGY